MPFGRAVNVRSFGLGAPAAAVLAELSLSRCHVHERRAARWAARPRDPSPGHAIVVPGGCPPRRCAVVTVGTAIASVLVAVVLLVGPASAEGQTRRPRLHAAPTTTSSPAPRAPREANRAGPVILVLVVVAWAVPFTVALRRARAHRSRLEEEDPR